MAKQLTDLQKFEKVFDCTHKKQIASGLEVRVTNLDQAKHDAVRLIKKNNWQLEVTSEGSMVSLRAFLVKPVQNETDH